MLQITQHAERLALLDQREATHFRETAERLADIARTLAEVSGQVSDVHDMAARQSALLDTLDGLDKQVATLATRLTAMPDSRSDADRADEYQPAPAPRWWKLDGRDREEALARLGAWVEQIYRPGYGHLAAGLGPCWDQHPLCLYGLDWLMELWSLLYLAPDRFAGTIASQAEWQTRLLPALAEQMYLETTRCPHARQRDTGQRSPINRSDVSSRPWPQPQRTVRTSLETALRADTGSSSRRIRNPEVFEDLRAVFPEVGLLDLAGTGTRRARQPASRLRRIEGVYDQGRVT
jgi:hypothetical protein